MRIPHVQKTDREEQGTDLPGAVVAQHPADFIREPDRSRAEESAQRAPEQVEGRWIEVEIEFEFLQAGKCAHRGSGDEVDPKDEGE